MKSLYLSPLIALFLVSCAKHSQSQPSDGGTVTGAPTPSWAFGYQASLFARALDVSCAPADAQPGVDGCITLLRYRGALSGVNVPASGDEPYGSIVSVRTDAAGNVVWVQTAMAGFDPDGPQTGAFIDDDLRIHMLPTGGFWVSGTYEGHVLVGSVTGTNEGLGTSAGRDPFVYEFNPDGTATKNWGDVSNGKELHAADIALLANGTLAVVGSCQGDLPLGIATLSCGALSSGYVFVTTLQNVPLLAVDFGGTWPAQALDVVGDDDNNMYVSGTFQEQMTYGSLAPDLAAGEDDGFLMKVEPDGTRDWITTAGGLGRERGGRLARVPGGTLWTARVSLGARIGATVYPNATQVVSKIDDTGAVLWTETVPDASAALPLGIAAADDGSFALYGDGFLGRYDASGKLLWQSLDAEVRGASFTSNSLVVAANVVGSDVLGASIAATADQVLRGAVIALPR